MIQTCDSHKTQFPGLLANWPFHCILRIETVAGQAGRTQKTATMIQDKPRGIKVLIDGIFPQGIPQIQLSKSEIKRSKFICKCGNPRRISGGNCLECHRKYIQKFRKKHPLTSDQRKKMNCRSYTHTYVYRGLIKRENCDICGYKKTQIHHDNYDLPLSIRWLCKTCHSRFHRGLFSFILPAKNYSGCAREYVDGNGGSPNCKCGNPRRKSGRYCLVCHAKYLAEYRERKKQNKTL